MPKPILFSTKSLFRITAVGFVFASASLISQPANAGFQPIGFQWVAPAEAPPAPAYTPPAGAWNPQPQTEAAPPQFLAPAPAAPVTAAPSVSSIQSTPLAGENPQVISPIVIEGAPLAPSSEPMPAVPGNSSLSTANPLPTSLPPSDSVVQGFANNVPLAVALREVLPPGYGFSIDQDVDLGTLVSFQGGKPWRETLQAMLQPAGLSMREQNEMIAIGRTQSGSAAMVPSPAMANTTAAPYPSSPEMNTMNAPPAANPLPYAVPAAATSSPGSFWSGKMAGPKPAIAQPNVQVPGMTAPLQVSSSRISSTSIVDTWTASRGDTLHKVLQDWSRRAGAEFEWSAEYDYPLGASISFTGTFEEAVRSLLSGFEDAHPQPVAELHANPGAGQMVLVIQTRGNSYAD